MRDQIQSYISTKYNGSLRFIKEKMFINQFGTECYNNILLKTGFITKPFSLKLYCWLNNITSHPICKSCTNHVKYNSNTGWQTYCSNECRFKDMSHIQTIKKKTNLEKYGATNVLASELGKQKAKQTHLTKYGVEHYNKTLEYKERIKSGDIKRSSNAIKTQQSHFKRYFNYLQENIYIRPNFTLEEYHGTYNRYSLICNTCKTKFQHILGREKLNEQVCNVCFPKKGTKSERLMQQFLDKHKIEYICRARKEFNNEYELDFYIPSLKIGIEIHGLYWHSEKIIPATYHNEKLDFFNKQGIRLIQIFEDELIIKQKLVFSKLKHILLKSKYKIGGRKCSVGTISSKVKNKFIEKYHVQGDAPSKVNIGIFYKNRLVGCATFNNLRRILGHKNKDTTKYELIRYTTINNFNIIGGLSKIIKYFKSNYTVSGIISYADRRWSQGNLYQKVGFTLQHITPPNYWYTKHFMFREHRWKYRKSELHHLLAVYDEKLTEKQNMHNNKYTRIWDCGNYKFVLE